MELLTVATSTITAGLFATSAARFASSTLGRWRSRMRIGATRHELQHLRAHEAQHARMAGELAWQQQLATKNTGLRVMEVVELAEESDDCRSFYLQDPLGLPLPNFLPGQFVTVRPALGGTGIPSRCYSLSDLPGLPWYRITVKRHHCTPQARAAAAQAGQCVGLSNWLHEEIQVGDSLLVSQPAGEFIVPEHLANEVTQTSSTPIVMLAAGIGITPAISMTKSILKRCPEAPLSLFFQVQDDRHWPFGPTLHQWAASCPGLHIESYFSRSTELPRVEAGKVASGKYDAKMILRSLKQRYAGLSNAQTASTTPRSAHYFLCGPMPWMQSLIESLLQCGIPSDHVHYESFGSGTSLTADDESNTPTEPWSLTLASSGLEISDVNRRQTIWQAAKEHGVELPSACHNGVCGTCKLRLLKGNVKYRQPPTCHLSEGEVLSCVAEPQGQVIVQA